MVSTCARNSFWILQKWQIKKPTHFTSHIYIYIYIYILFICVFLQVQYIYLISCAMCIYIYIYIFYICTFQGSCARFRCCARVRDVVQMPAYKMFIHPSNTHGDGVIDHVLHMTNTTWVWTGFGGGYHGKPSRLQTKPYKQDMRQLHKRFHYISIGSPSINNDKQTSKPQ